MANEEDKDAGEREIPWVRAGKGAPPPADGGGGRKPIHGKGIPPWHLWGGRQIIETTVEVVGAVRQGNVGQLAKVSYARPETWHWLFSAQLLQGPDNTPGFFTRIFVHWDLTVGIGRSTVDMASLTNFQVIRGFDDYQIQWGPAVPTFPVGLQIWTTQTKAPNRIYNSDAFVVSDEPIQQIVGSDLNLNVRVVALTIVDNLLAAGQPVKVEVAALFSPKTHIRPEWHLHQMSGGEERGA